MATKRSRPVSKKRKLATSPSKSLTKLEAMPSEILIEIYIKSENPSFVFCSSYLHGLVQYNSVKTKLIQQCCTDPTFKGRSSTPAQNNLRMLLQETWISRGWILDAGLEWLKIQVLAPIKEWLYDEEASSEETDTILQNAAKYLQGYRDFLLHIVPHKPTCEFRGRVSSSFRAELDRPQHRIGHWVPYCIICPSGLSADVCFTFSRTRRGLSHDVRPEFMPVIEWRALPDRLLTGPWSQNDGDILGLFLPALKITAGGNTRKPTKTQFSNMRHGLTRAINDETLPALALYSGHGYKWGVPVQKFAKTCPGIKDAITREADHTPWQIPRELSDRGYPLDGYKVPKELWNTEHRRSARAKARELLRRNGDLVGDDWNERTKDCVMYKLLTREREFARI